MLILLSPPKLHNQTDQRAQRFTERCSGSHKWLHFYASISATEQPNINVIQIDRSLLIFLIDFAVALAKQYFSKHNHAIKTAVVLTTTYLKGIWIA